MSACESCGASESDRAMVFRGERWCSDNCRKIVQSEKPPAEETTEKDDHEAKV